MYSLGPGTFYEEDLSLRQIIVNKAEIFKEWQKLAEIRVNKTNIALPQEPKF